ncbi:MAG: class I tRNA ligase family protein, partial [Pelagibacterales bacterium]|nr:class I tRNA ligase family protein [Pelagibacterales bacterium]
KKFVNKVWNASRVALMQIGHSKIQIKNIESQTELTQADKKILKQLKETSQKITKYLKDYQFGSAAHLVYDFFWHDFCDKYIESAKKQNDQKTKEILAYVLLNSLKILHPFIPFATEAIYQTLSFKEKELLMIEEWPK